MDRDAGFWAGFTLGAPLFVAGGVVCGYLFARAQLFWHEANNRRRRMISHYRIAWHNFLMLVTYGGAVVLVVAVAIVAAVMAA